MGNAPPQESKHRGADSPRARPSRAQPSRVRTARSPPDGNDDGSDDGDRKKARKNAKERPESPDELPKARPFDPTMGEVMRRLVETPQTVEVDRFPGAPGFRYQPHQLLSQRAVFMDSDLPHRVVERCVLLVASVSVVSPGREAPRRYDTNRGAFGEGLGFFPMTHGFVERLIETFGRAWPMLKMLRDKRVRVSRREPQEPCPPRPAGTGEDEVHTACFLKHRDDPQTFEPVRDDTPFLLKKGDATDFWLRGDTHAGGGTFHADMRLLLEQLYKQPCLAYKSTLPSKDAKFVARVTSAMRSFTRSHRASGAQERGACRDNDHVMKVHWVDRPVGVDTTRLAILTEGAYMDALSWVHAAIPYRAGAFPDPMHEGYLCCCVKLVHDLLSAVKSLAEEGCVHSDIKLDNVGVSFHPLRFFLLDLDCVTQMGQNTMSCTAFHDVKQLQYDHHTRETEVSKIVNPYDVYADIYRAALAVELATSHPDRNPLPIFINAPIRVRDRGYYSASDNDLSEEEEKKEDDDEERKDEEEEEEEEEEEKGEEEEEEEEEKEEEEEEKERAGKDESDGDDMRDVGAAKPKKSRKAGNPKKSGKPKKSRKAEKNKKSKKSKKPKRSGKPKDKRFDPEVIVAEMEARVATSVDALKRVPGEPRDGLSNTARRILSECIQLQTLWPEDRTEVADRLIKQCKRFFADFDTELYATYNRDFVARLPDAEIDSRAVRLFTMRLVE